MPVILPAFDPEEVERLLKQLEKEVESGETTEELKKSLPLIGSS